MVYLTKNLRYLRGKKNIANREVAALMDTYTSRYGNWETGFSTPSFDDLIKIAGVFDVSVHNLVFNDIEQDGVTAMPPASLISSEELYAAYNNATDDVKRQVDEILGIGPQ